MADDLPYPLVMQQLPHVIRRCLVIREEDASKRERRDSIRRYLMSLDEFISIGPARHVVIERWVRTFVP